MNESNVIWVETAARLHFGVLDLRGARGRWFGGIGASAPAPTLLLSAERADTLEVTGDDAERASAFAARYLQHHGLQGGAAIHVHRALPRHAGLGSGTQLGLAVARALAGLYGRPTDGRSLARAVGRAKRSAIGTWTFEGGGLVVEGGRHPDREECGPLIARLPFPPDWRCVLAVPTADTGISGASEEAAFATLPPPTESEVERVAHLVLMVMLPAVADADLSSFGHALTRIQEITGCWFASVQGGPYARGASEEVVRLMSERGVPGVGQSSWGPSIYGIVRGEAEGQALARAVQEQLGPRGAVYEGPLRAEGARVWTGGSQLRAAR